MPPTVTNTQEEGPIVFEKAWAPPNYAAGRRKLKGLAVSEGRTIELEKAGRGLPIT